MISTRCRYAIRVLVDLAEQGKTDYIPIREVAERQQISLKYLEQILPVLRKHGLILAVQGKGGGYKLAREPHEYKISEILDVTGEELAPVACLAKDAGACPRAASCKTLPMWRGFAKLARNYFDGITLEDIVNQRIPM